ncbi:MAG: hypothetical protein CMP81_09790 [Fulvimarina sp.]|nr:hypothetical protein [Fulvimarina sp.]
MADFATKQDLIDRFGSTELTQLTDRTNRPPTMIDDTVVSQALGDASALASGYVGKIYQLPLAEVPQALVKAVADIARYYLHGSRATKDGEEERAYKEAVGWLKDVARGTVQLDVGGVPPAQPQGGTVRVVAPQRRFSRESLRNM